MNHIYSQGLKTAEIIARETEFGAMNYKPLDIVLARGEGVYVWDVEGGATWIVFQPIPPLTRAIAIPAYWQR